MTLEKLAVWNWSSSAIVQSLIRWIYPYGAKRRVCRGALRGKTILVGPGMGFSYIWNLGGGGDWNWIKHVDAGSVVYDIGANCGQSTLHLATAVGPGGCVVAFEPATDLFERMVANVAINGLRQVIPVCAAASNREGMAQFAFNANTPSQSYLSADMDPSWLERHVLVSVPVLPLDSFKERGWPAPSMLKIDVEGGAKTVFDGAHEILSVHRPSFMIELHSLEEQTALKEVMHTYRYRTTHEILGNIEDPTARWASPLFCEPLSP